MPFVNNIPGGSAGSSAGVPTRGPTSAKPQPSSGGFWDRVQAIGQQKWDAMVAGPGDPGWTSGNPDINTDAVNAGAFGASSALSALKNPPGSGGRPGRPSSPRSPGSPGGHDGGAPSAAGIDYLYADLAKHYGFSAETAYQEALANTQYSRAVEDMQRAGLNPASIFGSGKGYTAGDDIWPSSPRGGGGGGGGGSRRSGGRRSGGRGSSGDRLFSTSAYAMITAAAGITGAVITKNPSGYWIGASMAQGAMNALDVISKWGR